MTKVNIPAPLSYEPPRWYLEDFDSMDEAIAKDITSAIYWRRVHQLEEEGKSFSEGDEVASATLLANAILSSALQADNISDGAHRAMLRQLWEVQRNGLFHMAPEEYGSVQEWLMDRIPRLSPTSGELSDVMFLLEHLFPMLERIGNGWDPATLLSFKEHWSKTRAAIPYMRMITKQMNAALSEIDSRLEEEKRILSSLVIAGEEPEAIEHERRILIAVGEEKREAEERELKDWREGIEKALNVIANPEIPAGDDRQIKSVLFGEGKYSYSFTGMKALVGNKTAYYVEIDKDYERAIESALRTIVDFQLTDLAVIHNQINTHFKLFKGG
jgi:hypothetical protein